MIQSVTDLTTWPEAGDTDPAEPLAMRAPESPRAEAGTDTTTTRSAHAPSTPEHDRHTWQGIARGDDRLVVGRQGDIPANTETAPA